MIGGFWLIAWLSGIAAQWSRGDALIPTTNVSLGLVLASAALLLLGAGRPGPRRRWTGMAAAAVVLLGGVLTLTEHLLRYDLGIDQLVATEPAGAAGLASANRMGPPAAVCLMLLGAGLLAMARRRRTIVPYLGIAVCVITFLPAVGYLYGLDQLYRLPAATSIAWQTLAGLMALGIG